MSNAVYPTLPGLTWPVKRTSVWRTRVQSTPSGREWRASAMLLPRYRYSLQYEFLRSDAAFGEFQSLFGFVDARRGSFDTFLFLDHDDKTATAQPFGAGDGSTVQFQLVRTLGGFACPVYDLVAAPQIFADGVLLSSGYTVGSTGLVTFSTAPVDDVVLTWSGTFYWRVRFDADELTIEKFMAGFWKTGEVRLITVKP